MYGFGVVPVPHTNVHVDPPDSFRSTMNVTSTSTAGTAGTSVTADQATCAVPNVGLVAVGAGAPRVATTLLALPLPDVVQNASPPTTSASAHASGATTATRRAVSTRLRSAPFPST